MTKRTWSATYAAITLGLTAGLVAQTPPSTPQTQSSASPKSITVTGCVQKAPESPTGTTGAAAASSASEAKFLLTNISMSPSGTTGTAGSTSPSASASASTASQYRLDTDDAKLTPHIGHKVEISGTVEPTASASGSERSTPPSEPRSAAGASSSAPKLKVDTVKMVASSCP